MKKYLFVLLPIVASPLVWADEESQFSVGVAAVYGSSPYVGYKNAWGALPSISYENRHFYIEGLSAGAKLWEAEDESQQLTLDAYYLPRELRPSKSRDERIKQLDKRKSTVMAGLSYNIHTPYGSFENAVSYDVAGHSKGVLAMTQYGFVWEFSPKFSIKPAIGLTYTDRKFNQYYYGVSEQESVKSGLPAYKAKAALQPHIELTANYQFTPKLSAFMVARAQKLTGRIHRSPIIDNKYETETGVGILYSF